MSETPLETLIEATLFSSGKSMSVHELSEALGYDCLLYTSPSPRDATLSRMPSSA